MADRLAGWTVGARRLPDKPATTDPGSQVEAASVFLAGRRVRARRPTATRGFRPTNFSMTSAGR